MKIVIAAPVYPPEVGGPATYAKLLEENLPGRGIDVALVKFGEVRHLPKLVRHAIYFLRVLRIARVSDLVYALDATSVGFPAAFAAKLAGKPFAVKVVGDYAWEQGRQRYGVTAALDDFVKTGNVAFPLRLLRRVQTIVAKNARCVVVPSRYVQGIVAAWGIPKEKIVVVHNAIRAEDGGEAPEAIKLPPRPLVVSVGRLVPWKGFSELIEAVALVRAKGIAVSLAIVGDGPDRATLEEKARRILGRNFALTGALTHRQTFEVMRSADVFVLDSLYEGLSHTIVEACFVGVPVIASDIGGNREVVADGDNGLLVPPENPQALAEALARVLSDDALCARLSARARASAADFSVDAMIAATAQRLRSLV